MASVDFSVADVLAWARTKPADERYCYQHRGNCALCQFLKDTGRAGDPLVDCHSEGIVGQWRDRNDGWNGPTYTYPPELEYPLGGEARNTDYSHSWTFGALVTRLEALVPETVVTSSEWTRLDAYLTDTESVRAEQIARKQVLS